MDSGIYKIVNNMNGKIYIGSSINLTHRKTVHYSYLRRDRHPNKHLQFAWNHYGEEAFSFEVLLYCDPHQLLYEEKQIIEETSCCDREIGYNISSEPTAPMQGRRHSVESIKKMTVAKTRDKNPFFGKTHSEETKKKISSKKTGRKLDEKHKKKVLQTAFSSGEKNVNAKLTDEQVAFVRQEAAIYYAEKGSHWGFYSKMARIVGVNSSTIARIVKKEIR